MTNLVMYDGSIEAIEAMIKAGDDAWEAMVSAGIEAREYTDSGRWTIGDLALLVKTEYSENRIAEFAKSIKAEVGRVREYRTMCKFWEKSVREAIANAYPGISYSHMREAKRLKVLKDAEAFIQKCADLDWTVEKAKLELDKILGKPTPPRKLVDIVTHIVNVPNREQVTFELPAEFQEFLAPIRKEREYRLVLYEVLED